ncbi:NeuD/PglB/VioB family sugar acetyltransferase [Nocardioides astragali]|uniref:NeuD/PglB/VioB family sugar acetyltransferase n=1 Tax=Nocardioides astragali TaxID=1776736 RepID=A0ABW2MZ76_9ACTN|nr:NeuD/PglB/VioB family sugar acetyltransferase [Nocardioides astragali]
MSTRIVIVGGGGFGREVIDVIEAINAAAPEPLWELVGVVDDSLAPDNRERLAKRSISYLGTADDFLATCGGPVAYAVGIGAPSVRRKVALRFEEGGHSGAILLHPSATMGSEVTIGAGTVACAGVRITTNITIGRHVHLNPNVTVGHDTSVGDFVSLNPSASISGDCVVESGVLVGVGGIVLNRLRVGQDAVVGGAACAVRDVAPGTTVVGVPARPLGQR